LSRAIIENRADITLLLLDLNASSNTVNNSDYMPIFLFLQSKLNNLNIFSRILKKTKNINAQVNFGQTLLHYVCDTNFRQHAYAYLELLLNAGSNVNIINFEGYTPLIVAIKYSSPEVVALLIKHGANINFSNTSGYCPLYAAYESGSSEKIFSLIDAGVDVNINYVGQSPLHIMCVHFNKLYDELLFGYHIHKNITNSPNYALDFARCEYKKETLDKYQDIVVFILMQINQDDIQILFSPEYTILRQRIYPTRINALKKLCIISEHILPDIAILVVGLLYFSEYDNIVMDLKDYDDEVIPVNFDMVTEYTNRAFSMVIDINSEEPPLIALTLKCIFKSCIKETIMQMEINNYSDNNGYQII
jgi:ankyrin repeat protein